MRAWGLIDKNGEFVLPPKYDHVGAVSSGDPVRAVLDGRILFLNLKAEVVIEGDFKETEWFSEGVCPVSTGSTWGFIDRGGNVVIDYQYDTAHQFQEGRAVVGRKLAQKERFGVIDATGKEIVAPQYAAIGQCWEDRLVVENDNLQSGYLDRDGKLVVPIQYRWAGRFREGLAYVSNDRFTGYIDPEGKRRIRARGWFRGSEFGEGLAPVIISPRSQPSSGYIDRDGKIVIPASFDEAYAFEEGLAQVKLDKKFGYVDTSGHYVVHPQFSSVGDFREGLAAVKAGGRYFYIRPDGSRAFAADFAHAARFGNGHAAVSVDV